RTPAPRGCPRRRERQTEREWRRSWLPSLDSGREAATAGELASLPDALVQTHRLSASRLAVSLQPQRAERAWSKLQTMCPGIANSTRAVLIHVEKLAWEPFYSRCRGQKHVLCRS